MCLLTSFGRRLVYALEQAGPRGLSTDECRRALGVSGVRTVAQYVWLINAKSPGLIVSTGNRGRTQARYRLKKYASE